MPSMAKHSRTLNGNISSRRCRARISAHSAGVVSFGRVGEEATAIRSFIGTSASSKVSFSASGAACASLPPLTAEKYLRTVLISVIVAPDATSSTEAHASPSLRR